MVSMNSTDNTTQDQEFQNEEWRDVVGYEGWYEVSDHGRVKRVKQAGGGRAGRILQETYQTNGYAMVNLSRKNKIKRLAIHRLVLSAFVSLPEKSHVANHKNGIKTDNHVSNLEWTTYWENDNHSRNVLGKHFRGETNPQAKLTEEDVIYIRKAHSDGVLTQTKLARKYNVSHATIHSVVYRKTWTHI
jgi:hypothetical protein